MTNPALDLWKEDIDEPIRQARENVECWHTQWGPTFSGHVKVGGSEATAETRVVGDPVIAERITSQTRLPFGFEQAGAMFAERDRLRALAAECGDTMPSAAEITAQAVKNTQETAQ